MSFSAWTPVAKIIQFGGLRLTVGGLPMYHSVNSSSHSVNGDIAIQWE